LIEFTAEARDQVANLRRYYRRESRFDALRVFERAVAEALARIEAEPERGSPAPRPYPSLARPGQAWCKVRRYWFRYSLTSPPVITGVFFETANIPGRM
jgi:hypothetical protein